MQFTCLALGVISKSSKSQNTKLFLYSIQPPTHPPLQYEWLGCEILQCRNAVNNNTQRIALGYGRNWYVYYQIYSVQFSTFTAGVIKKDFLKNRKLTSNKRGFQPPTYQYKKCFIFCDFENFCNDPLTSPKSQIKGKH